MNRQKSLIIFVVFIVVIGITFALVHYKYNSNSSHLIMSKGNNTYVYEIPVDCSYYNIKSTSDNYNLVLIKGFSLNMKDDRTPVLPLKGFIIDIPLTAHIESVKATFDNPVSLGHLNIPAFERGDPTKDDMHYVSLSNAVDIYPPNYSYHIVEPNGYKEVIVKVIPVKFDSAIKEVTLYKKCNITITYTAKRKGIVKGGYVYKTTSDVGSKIKSYTTIENTSPALSAFTVRMRLEDENGKTIATITKKRTIKSGETAEVAVPVSTYLNSGAYTVIADVFDDNNMEIGKWQDVVYIKESN